MIEAYAFLAMFTIQILALSALYPSWFIKYLRLKATLVPTERLVPLYPGVDPNLSRERFFARYRALNTGIAALGLVLMGWLYSFMRRRDSGYGPVEILVAVYFLMQVLLPLCLVVSRGIRFRAHKQSLLESKRRAVLQRRGLFDFVPPSIVFLAAVSYLLFAALMLYIREHPFPGFSGLINIGVATLVYALQASVVYAVLYGKKPNPFETHAGRLRTIGMAVKSCVYSCIACVVFLSLNCTLGLLNLQRWEPFALSAFFVFTALLSLMNMTAAPRTPESNGIGPGGQQTPGTPDLPV